MGREERRRKQRKSRRELRDQYEITGKDKLEDLKLKKELMKMIMEDHLKQVREHLPKEDAEKMIYQWNSSDGEEWITHG